MAILIFYLCAKMNIFGAHELCKLIYFSWFNQGLCFLLFDTTVYIKFQGNGYTIKGDNSVEIEFAPF